MMSAKKWLIVAGLGAALGLVTVGVVLVVIWRFVSQGGRPVDYSLPVYTFEQTDSTHPGYRRTTITSGTTVYVQAYEEYALRLANPDPTNAVGRTAFGGGKICAIPGQPPTDYLAVDCGSEMPAYEVFRNSQRPPFDWRTVKFQTLEVAANNSGVSSNSASGTIGLTTHKRTTDPAVIEDVLRTLREGTPTTLPSLVPVTTSNLDGVHLISDQLPGLIFSPAVYRDPAGPVYLAESLAVEFTNRTTRIHARWIVASPLFTKWVQTP